MACSHGIQTGTNPRKDFKKCCGCGGCGRHKAKNDAVSTTPQQQTSETIDLLDMLRGSNSSKEATPG